MFKTRLASKWDLMDFRCTSLNITITVDGPFTCQSDKSNNPTCSSLHNRHEEQIRVTHQTGFQHMLHVAQLLFNKSQTLRQQTFTQETKLANPWCQCEMLNRLEETYSELLVAHHGPAREAGNHFSRKQMLALAGDGNDAVLWNRTNPLHC